jgi:hypothetical protein
MRDCNFTVILLLHFLLLSSCLNDDQDFTSLDQFLVKIVSPYPNETLVPGSSVLFKGVLYGDTTINVSKLKVVWSSNIDGVIYEGSVGKNFQTEFYIHTLSKNIHRITLRIYNEIDSILMDEITVFNQIKLEASEIIDNAVTLLWSLLADPNFYSYELYRSEKGDNIRTTPPIFIGYDRKDTVFKDSQAIIGTDSFYRVYATYNNKVPIGSNLLSVRAGTLADLDFPILKILPDPKRELLYGIVSPDDIDQQLESGYGMVILDLKDLTVKKRLLTNWRFNDMDINDNYLYLSTLGSSTIHKVNLNTQSAGSSFNVNNSVRGIKIGSGNRLYYHIAPPRYSSMGTEFRIVDLETEKELPYITSISDAYSNYNRGKFTIDPVNNNIYHGNLLSEPTIVRFSTTNDKFSSAMWKWGWGFLTHHILYKKGKVFWHHFLLDSNLELLGFFETEGKYHTILDVSPNGDFAISDEGIFATSNRMMLKKIPAFYTKATFINEHLVVLVKNINYPEPKTTLMRYSF